MKKILTIVFLLASVVAMQAQDTIHTRSLKRNYLAQQWWIDTFECTYAYPSHNYYCRNCEKIIKHFYSKDSIMVYGLAVSLHYRQIDEENILDPTDTLNSFEYFSFYELDSDSMDFHSVSDSLIFDRFRTPIEYYVDFGLRHPVASRGPLDPYPFSEVYFDEAYKVQDTFLIGFTHRSLREEEINYTDSVTGAWIWFARYPFETSSFVLQTYPPGDDWRETITITGGHISQDTGTKWATIRYAQPFMIYPILTPRPYQDTTTGVDNIQTVERFVALQPNPASERVQVVSNVGLNHVEVYNTAGVKVMDLPASGLSLTLNIDALPEDTYLVRVATPVGNVTKKLVVSHQ